MRHPNPPHPEERPAGACVEGRMSSVQPLSVEAAGAAAYWRNTLWAMVGIQFVMTAAFSMLTPIMPLFLPVLGVESDSAIAIWAGILNGVTSLVAAFASPLWGQVADRHGRKLMLLRSSFAIALFTALMGASDNVWQFFACRALMGVFAGFSSAAIALVASQVPEGRRGTFASLFALVTTPALLALFFVLLMAQFGVRTVQPIVTLYVKEMVGDLPNVATLAGIAFSITGLANVISAPFLGNRSDRIGYRRVLLICLAGGTLTTLPQAFTDNYWLFTAERFAVGLFIGGLLPAANALVGRLVSRAERGAVYGMTSSAMFLGNSAGPLLGGAIAASFGLHWVFLMTAIVMAINLAWVYYRVPEYGAAT